MDQERTIFRRGSTTFFMSSLFFPRAIRQDVFDLYSFVRVADDYVDHIPADREAFYRLKKLWQKSAAEPAFETAKHTDDTTDLRVVKNIVRLSRKHDFETGWIQAFLDAMESDLSAKNYRTIDDTLHYVYGSAEVVGLMMAKIMQLQPEAMAAAKMQGRAMQAINFIRDIEEDNRLGRRYLPLEDLKRFNLEDLSRQTAMSRPDDFQKFIRFQLDRYNQWQAEAYKGYKYIPKRLRIPLQTATDMYNWTAQEILKDSLKIYEIKIKPSKQRVVRRTLTNII